MGTLSIDGIIRTPLKIVPNPKGNILHVLKQSDIGYKGFGEAYFSIIDYGEVKGWKKHTKMTSNLVVPIGEIKFVLYDDRPSSVTRGNYVEERLSVRNFKRLTVPPGIWMGFQGLDKGLNLLLNIIDIEHDPSESESAEINKIVYDWNNGL